MQRGAAAMDCFEFAQQADCAYVRNIQSAVADIAIAHELINIFETLIVHLLLKTVFRQLNYLHYLHTT